MTSAAKLLTSARRAAGLSQDELARRAGTSRTTVSAYEHGRKSPTTDTALRLLAKLGFELTIRPRVTAVQHTTSRGRIVTTLSALPRLPLDRAFAVVSLPIHLNWSEPTRQFNLARRAERARVYEIVLREGGADDILEYIDGALLIDLWDDLVLPPAVRATWAPLVQIGGKKVA